MKAHLAFILAAAIMFATAAQATEIRQFDRFDGDDQIRFVDKLIDSVEAAANDDPALSARVKRFFMSKKPGEEISGMGQFELSLSLARIADMEASAKNPKAPRLEVEDVMYAVLFNNGFRFTKAFRPTAIDFQPQKPLGRVLTRQDGDKALAETRDWIARTVRPAPEHDFTHGGPGAVGWSGWSDDQKTIAFFTAMIAASAVLGRMGVRFGEPAPAPGQSWEQNYRHAQRVACAATLDTNCRDRLGNPW